MHCAVKVKLVNKLIQYMIKLYEFPPTRSIRVRWTLQELGVDFESHIVDMMAGEHRDPGFLAINPAGKLPVIVDGDLVLTESIAIVLYLCERDSDRGLLPVPVDKRAEVYQWLLFTTTELEQPLWRIALHTSLYDEKERNIEEVALASRDFHEMARVLETHLEGKTFLVGDAFSVADVVCGYTLDWAGEAHLLEAFPNARHYMERLYERPAAAMRISQAFASLEAVRA